LDTQRVEDFLAHYASKYYDPVKAKEYYERTKELKGREPQLSKESREKQSQATAYVRNEISTRKKADLDANAAVRNQLTNEAKSQTEAHAARMEKLKADTEATKNSILSKLGSEITKIQGELKIPANASPKLRAYLEKQQASRSNRASAKSKGEIQKLQKDARAVVTKFREEYKALREKNAAARRANAEQRRSQVEMYRNDLQTETQNIKDNVR
jgi:hypothetical protein